jgi:cell division protein FtsL
MMQSYKLSLLLWGLIIVSAFAVIAGSHRSRSKFIELQELLVKAQDYDVEWGQLLIEKSTLASYLGLENVAKDELKMTFPVRSQIVIVEEPKP